MCFKHILNEQERKSLGDQEPISPLKINKRSKEESPFNDKSQSKAVMNIVTESGSVFFNKMILRQMVDQKFEYMHQSNSIFKNMEILMKPRGELSEEYLKQSDFMEIIKIGIRGDTTPDKILNATKFFTVVTLKQILCQLL